MPADAPFAPLTALDTSSASTPPDLEPGQPTPAGVVEAPCESRTFASMPPQASDAATEPSLRPQSDFGAPITLDRGPAQAEGEPAAADDAPEPTLTGGDVPPLFADADETAAFRTAEPPPQRPLSVRISQGMPSYSEPEPDIAGINGKAARGEGATDPADHNDQPIRT